MTINIIINEHPFYYALDCKIYGATADEKSKIEEFGLYEGGWGGTELEKDGLPELNYKIRQICGWAQNNGKSIVIKRVTSI